MSDVLFSIMLVLFGVNIGSYWALTVSRHSVRGYRGAVAQEVIDAIQAFSIKCNLVCLAFAAVTFVAVIFSPK